MSGIGGSSRRVRRTSSKFFTSYHNPHPDKIEVPDNPPDYREDPDAALLWAKDAWWRRLHPIEVICKSTNLPVYTLKKKLQGNKSKMGWVEEREHAYVKLLRGAIDSDRIRIDAIIKKMLDILENTTENYLMDGKEMSIQDYDRFVGSFEKLFKMRQLLMGSPTEIYGEANLTWGNVLDKLRQADILYKDNKNTIEIKPGNNSINLTLGTDGREPQGASTALSDKPDSRQTN